VPRRRGSSRRPARTAPERDRANQELALRLACPYCGVRGGSACRTRSHRRREVPHAARLDLADPTEVATLAEDRERAARAQKARQRSARWLAASVTALLVTGAAAGAAFHDSAAEPEWLVAPTPATVERNIVGWEPLHCADGWLSTSIGRQGACSHHGGVAGGAIYKTVTTPAVEGVIAPPRTDWGKVVGRGFWSLVVGGLVAFWIWIRWLFDWIAGRSPRPR
jgi:hypothetical protein